VLVVHILAEVGNLVVVGTVGLVHKPWVLIAK
jgi:hypothetical protein